MPRATIRDIFHGQYLKCLISGSSLPYKWNRKKNSEVYSVDCVISSGNKGNRPDEFIFLNAGKPGDNTTGLYLVERKSVSSNVGKVKRQLQGGADFIDDFIRGDRSISSKHKIVFRPVLVATKVKQSAHKAHRELRRETVTLRGQKEQIHVLVRQGGKLPHIP